MPYLSSIGPMNRVVDGLGLSVVPEDFAMDGKMLSQGYDGLIEAFDPR